MNKIILTPKTNYGRIDYYHNNKDIETLLNKKTLSQRDMNAFKNLGIAFNLDLSTPYQDVINMISI